MEKKYKSPSIFRFQKRYLNDRQFYEYSATNKWNNRFSSKKLGHTHYIKGINEFDSHYTRFGRIESPKAGTFYHKCKFSPCKAFYIVYCVASDKSAIKSGELSRKLELNQFDFKQKVMMEMESSQNFLTTRKLKIEGPVRAARTPKH